MTIDKTHYKLYIFFLPTERNRPTLDIFRSIGFNEPQENLFVFDYEKTLLKPDAIEIHCNSEIFELL